MGYTEELIKFNKQADLVEKPSHYNRHGVECIEAIRASMSAQEFQGYLKGNCIKYLWRYRYKGEPVQDLGKAKKYLDWLILSLTNDQK